jgi:hypothetical protein
MKLHANAMTCPHSRRLAVDRIEREGWTLAVREQRVVGGEADTDSDDRADDPGADEDD